MEFKVSLDQFEGPLDLMLHLIHTSKLDLFDLNLDVLASQYLDYIRRVMNIGLDVSSEYLVEFTGLMEIKSRKLLPRREVEMTDTYQPDPAKELQARLIEYQKCKEEAKLLSSLKERRESQLDRSPASLIDEWIRTPDPEAKLELKSADLQKAFMRVLKRHALLRPYQTQMEVKELSLEERMKQIENMDIFTSEPFLFDALLEDVHTLRAAVVTFLALLELVHAGVASVRLDEEDRIWIQKTRTVQ